MKPRSQIINTLVALLLVAGSITVAISSESHAGGFVGNGGDAVFCSSSATSPFSGYYSLDYLATYDYGSQNSDIPTLPTKESLTQIRLALSGVSELVQSFDEYRSLYLNSDPLKTRVWRMAPYGIVDLNDELLLTHLPPNCRQSDQSPKLIQAVVREGLPGHIIYNYDPSMFDKLEQIPLQLSFLIVHEWLWDFADSAVVVREANRLLHSKNFNALTGLKKRELLRAVGLKIAKDDPAPPEIRTIYIEVPHGPGLFSLITGQDDGSVYFAKGATRGILRLENTHNFPNLNFLRVDSQMSKVISNTAIPISMWGPSSSIDFTVVPGEAYFVTREGFVKQILVHFP